MTAPVAASPYFLAGATPAPRQSPGRGAPWMRTLVARKNMEKAA